MQTVDPHQFLSAVGTGLSSLWLLLFSSPRYNISVAVIAIDRYCTVIFSLLVNFCYCVSCQLIFRVIMFVWLGSECLGVPSSRNACHSPRRKAVEYSAESNRRHQAVRLQHFRISCQLFSALYGRRLLSVYGSEQIVVYLSRLRKNCFVAIPNCDV